MFPSKKISVGKLLSGSASFVVIGALLPTWAYAAPTTSAVQAAPDGDAQVVVVTGTRANLKRAQQVKKDAPIVLEAVTPEELGQFDDNNIADILQRVPGVQVERDDASTDGDRVSIRGLGSNFVTTTFSGRTPVSSGSEGGKNMRAFNLDNIPSSIVNGLIVAKTPAADQVEQGLAGTVDVQLLSPLSANFKKGRNWFGSSEVRESYASLAGKTRPYGNFLVGARNKAKTLGWYLSGTHDVKDNPTSQMTSGGYIPGATAGRGTFIVDTNNDGIYNNGDTFYTNGSGSCTTAPAITGVTVVTTGPNANNAVACDNTLMDSFFGTVGLKLLQRVQTHDALAGAIEWKPTAHWDIVADYEHTTYSNVSEYYNLSAGFNSGAGTGGATPISNKTSFFKPGGVLIAPSGGPTSSPYIYGWDPAGFLGYLGSEGSGTSFTSAATNTNFRNVLSLVDTTGQFSSWQKLDMGGLKIKYSNDRLKVVTDVSASRNVYKELFTTVDIRQRYLNAYTLGGVGFNVSDGYPVITNIDKLNIAAPPVFTDVWNSAACATKICVEYNNTGALGLGTTPATQFTNGWNLAIGLGSEARKRQVNFTGANFAIRSDFTYDLDNSFFRQLAFGVRFSQNNIDSVYSVARRYAGNVTSTELGVNCTATDGVACIGNEQAAFINAVTHDSAGNLQTVTIGKNTPSQVTILKVNEQAACSFNPGFCTDTLENGGLIKRPNLSFKYFESVAAWYAGTNFGTDHRIGILPAFTGNVGVRWAVTDWSSSAGSVVGYNINIPTTGGGPVVQQCKTSAQLSMVPGACPVITIDPAGVMINTKTGTMNANGSFTTGSTSVLTKSLTSEGDSYLDAIYYATVPGSLRNPYNLRVGGRYVDALPTINLNFHLTRNLRMRLGASQVVSRPDPFMIAPTNSTSLSDSDAYEQGVAAAIVAQMNTGMTFDQAVQTDPVKTVLANTSTNIVTAGNPDIKPYRSTNLDFTLEYYTPNDGSIIFSSFNKHVKNFIIQALLPDLVYVDGYNFSSTIDANTTALLGKPIPFRVKEYVNYTDGDVKGYEIGFNQPFTFLPKPFKGLGMTANYTYVTSTFAKDIGNYGFGFPGSSKDNVNAVVYYGNRWVDFRVAYNYRSAYVRSLAGTGNQSNLTRFTAPQTYYDLTMTVKPTANLQIRLSGNNLGAQDREDYSYSPLAVMDRYTKNTIYTLSVRYTY